MWSTDFKSFLQVGFISEEWSVTKVLCNSAKKWTLVWRYLLAIKWQGAKYIYIQIPDISLITQADSDQVFLYVKWIDDMTGENILCFDTEVSCHLNCFSLSSHQSQPVQGDRCMVLSWVQAERGEWWSFFVVFCTITCWELWQEIQLCQSWGFKMLHILPVSCR